MPTTNLKQKHGATRGKIIAVAVLLIVFFGVLISQFVGSGPSQTTGSKVETTEPRTETKRPQAQPSNPPKRQSPGTAAKVKKTDLVRGENVTRNPASNKTEQPGAAKIDVERKDVAPWPSVSLPTVASHDPFALPVKVQHDVEEKLKVKQEEAEEAKQKAQAEQRAAVMLFAKTLQQAGVDMVMIKGDKRVARIGTETFRVGDVIHGYLRVTEIRDDGVIVVEPIFPVGDH